MTPGALALQAWMPAAIIVVVATMYTMMKRATVRFIRAVRCCSRNEPIVPRAQKILLKPVTALPSVDIPHALMLMRGLGRDSYRSDDAIPLPSDPVFGRLACRVVVPHMQFEPYFEPYWRCAMSATAIAAAHPAPAEDVSTVALTIVRNTQRVVSKCHVTANVLYVCFTLLRGNRRIRDLLGELRQLVSTLTVNDEDDRANLLNSAKELKKCVDALDKIHDLWTSEFVPRFWSFTPPPSWLGTQIADELRDLACTSEDIAETLALAASAPFAQLVQQELEACLPVASVKCVSATR